MRSIFFVLTLMMCSGLLGADDIHKEAKYYDKIDEHLEGIVTTDDIEANMAELRRWFNAKRSLLKKGSTIWPVIEQVLKMEDVGENYTKCADSDFAILESNNKALFSATRLKGGNYSLRRTDKLVHFYFARFAARCPSASRFFEKPSAEFGWKRRAYMQINEYVAEQRAKRKSEYDMVFVKELLAKLEQENKDGAITDAARQFVAMETQALADDKCTYKAYEILKSNEVAVRDFWYQPKPEFLKHYVIYMINEHNRLCEDVYPKNFQAKLAQLDKKSLRSAAILASEYYFISYARDDAIVSGIDRSKYTQINADFTTPQVIESMIRLSDRKEDPDDWIILMKPSNIINTLDMLVPQNLKVFVNELQPEYQVLVEKQDQSLLETTAKKLFTEYVVEPCQNYLAIMNDLLVPSMDSYFSSGEVSDVRKHKFMEQLGFLLGQTALYLCNNVVNLTPEAMDKIVSMISAAKFD